MLTEKPAVPPSDVALAREIVIAWNRWHDTPQWEWDTDRLVTDEDLVDRIAASLTHEKREAEERACPREHIGLERLMMKAMAGELALPDASLGQDVAAIAFAYERRIADLRATLAAVRAGECERCLAGEPLRMRWGQYGEYVSHAPDAHTPGMGCREEGFHRAQALYAEIKRLTPADVGKEVVHHACPCLHITPCNLRCTCVNGFSSYGCTRCCSYGSLGQQAAAAARIVAALEGGVKTGDLNRLPCGCWLRAHSRDHEQAVLAAISMALGSSEDDSS